MSGLGFTPEGRASARPIVSPPDKQTPLDEKEERRHPIHFAPLEAHNRSIIIFVTCCTAKRNAILASPVAHNAILGAWAKASAWLIGRYVVMSDHLHFFCAPDGIDAPSLERWMRYWKSRATSIMGKPSGTVWQRDHWDRQLRSGESYEEKWEYVRNNPVRHGYVTKADDWPYQGELNELRW